MAIYTCREGFVRKVAMIAENYLHEAAEGFYVVATSVISTNFSRILKVLNADIE
jgi:hypothetical protein